MHHILNIHIIDLKNDVINPEKKEIVDQRSSFKKEIKPSTGNYIQDYDKKISSEGMIFLIYFFQQYLSGIEWNTIS